MEIRLEGRGELAELAVRGRLDAYWSDHLAREIDRAIEGGSHREEWEAVLLPIGAGFDPANLHVVDHDDRDFLEAAPASATYVLPDVDLSAKSTVEGLRRAVVEHLTAARPLEVSTNAQLKLASRPGESPEAFAARCQAAAADAADREAAALRTKYEARLRREQNQAAAAADKVSRAEAAVNTKRSNELVDAVLRAASWVDLDVFSRRDGIKQFRGEGAEVKNALFNWGLAAIAWLVVGRVLYRVIKP